MKSPWVSKYCQGEVCTLCKQPAYAKAEEVLFDDDPSCGTSVGTYWVPIARHPLAAYLCRDHYRWIFGSLGVDRIEQVRRLRQGYVRPAKGRRETP